MDIRTWSTGMMFGSALACSLRRAALSVLLSLAAPVTWAQVGDCETFAAGLAEPVTLTAPLASGDQVTVQALLRRPAGDRVEGAIVVLHGFWGLRPPQCIHHHTDRLTEWGYATLLIDSPSQTTRSGVQMPEYSTNQQAAHALAGAAYLAARFEISPKRIGILGRSMGGLSTIKAVARADAPFAAAVALYPICPPPKPTLRIPLLLLVAGQDSLVSAADCEVFAAADPAGSIELVVYPQADHVFETPWHSAYDPAASEDALSRTRHHFEKHLGLGAD
jgi:dienelactone hydrolase